MKLPMRTAVLSAAWVTAGLVASCSDVETVSDSTFIVRGKAMTGARTRSPVVGGYVGLVSPEPQQWMTLAFAAGSGVPNKAVTLADGSFTFKVETSAVTDAADYPIFLAVTDSAQTQTLISEIPRDLVVAGAQLQLDLNPTTTAASELICPGGVYPPPSGAYCYSDPNHASSTRVSLIAIIDVSLAGTNGSLEASATLNWKSFMTTLLSDATAFSQLQSIATSAGLTSSSFTATAIPNAIIALPKVTQPIPGVDDNAPSESTSDGGCQASWSCGSSTQCATVMGGSSGTRTGFSERTSCDAWCAQNIPGNCSCSCS